MLSGVIHYRNGRAFDAAFPVPLYITMNRNMPSAAYRDATVLLRRGNVLDGEAQLSLAESEYQLGGSAQGILETLTVSLVDSPSSPEGWAFDAQLLLNNDPAKAAQALNQAITLAPYDFFTAGTRSRLAAQLWSRLDSETKNAALRQVRNLWVEPLLHNEIPPLLKTAGGTQLVNQAYLREPETLRDINRWVSARNRQLTLKKP